MTFVRGNEYLFGGQLLICSVLLLPLYIHSVVFITASNAFDTQRKIIARTWQRFCPSGWHATPLCWFGDPQINCSISIETVVLAATAFSSPFLTSTIPGPLVFSIVICWTGIIVLIVNELQYSCINYSQFPLLGCSYRTYYSTIPLFSILVVILHIRYWLETVLIDISVIDMYDLFLIVFFILLQLLLLLFCLWWDDDGECMLKKKKADVVVPGPTAL